MKFCAFFSAFRLQSRQDEIIVPIRVYRSERQDAPARTAATSFSTMSPELPAPTPHVYR